MAVTEALDEVDDRDMVERKPLYDYVDPDIFSRLRQEDSPWRFSFYTSSYEIRVSSLGTVTVYDVCAPEGESTTLSDTVAK